MSFSVPVIYPLQMSGTIFPTWLLLRY